jgi:hypothetical protein
MLSDRRWLDAETRVDFLDDLLDRIEAALERLEARAESLAPAGGMTQGRMSAGHFAYLAIREQAKTLNAMIERLDRAVEASLRPPTKNLRKGGRAPQQPGPVRPMLRRVPDIRNAWQQLLAGHGLPAAPMVTESDEHLPRLRNLTSDLLDELALLDAMVAGAAAEDGARRDQRLCDADQPGQRQLLLLRSQSDNAPLDALAQAYRAAFARQHGVSVDGLPPSPAGVSAAFPRTAKALLIDIPGGAGIFAGEQGTHLFISGGGAAGLLPVDVRLVPLGEDANAHLAAHAAVQPNVDRDRRDPSVIRIYGAITITLDLRTGLSCDGKYGGEVMRTMLLKVLPLPQEVLEH